MAEAAGLWDGTAARASRPPPTEKYLQKYENMLTLY